MFGDKNRVEAAVASMRERLNELPSDKVAKVDENCAVDFEEHFQYQEAQARAHAMGSLTTDEAQTVYIALGEVGAAENGGWAEGTDTATKVVVTQVVGELLASRVAATAAAA